MRSIITGEPRRFVAGHYARVKPVRPISERFWAKVDVRGPDECWLWTGSIGSHGYGTISDKGIHHTAHRAAYILSRGEIPNGMCICHSCDNRACVNPSHLWAGTDADNHRDMHAKGRAASTAGSKHARARFTETDIPVIRQLRVDGLSIREIAKRYGVTHQGIRAILKGETWRHVK